MTDVRLLGNAMIERIKTGQMRQKARELGIATEQDMDAMISAWEQWIEDDSAVLGIMNGEILIDIA